MAHASNDPNAGRVFIEYRYADQMRVIPYVKAFERLRKPNARPNDEDIAAILCPWCGRRHIHGWFSGPRGPHCTHREPGQSDYFIDCDETLPITIIKYR